MTVTEATHGDEWSVLIADDEPPARRGVRQLLSAFPRFRVVGECRDGASVLAALDAMRPDVVFLDVQMPGVDGFEVIRRRTPERMPAVVFLTAYDQHAIRAFDAQALDYLVKPVSAARFAVTMKRLERQLSGEKALRAPPTSPEDAVIVVPGLRGTQVIPMREIDWIEAADNYVRIWRNGKGHLLRESMRSLSERARALGFVRAHRKALVRLDGVRQVVCDRDGQMTVVLGCGTRIPVSRRLRPTFSAALKSRSA